MIRVSVAAGSSLPHLGAVPLFQSLEAAERSLFAPLCRVRAYDKGATIFEEGAPALDLSFVVLGRAKIVKAAQGRDLILGLFGPGEPIGAFAAMEGKTYPATAVALEPSTILHVPERSFFSVLGEHPQMTRRLIQGLMLRQMELTRRLADLTGPVEYRVGRLLLTLAERVGKRKGEGAEIPLTLSRQEIADLTATTVETAIRVMSRWGKEGLVATRADGFSIPDVAALRRRIEET
jgi:CRP/FNR family transcriptional regulator, nitrogen oxide reductase regulator